ncbi:MAG: molybdenum cofactor guanylyltransferase [Chloroflexi bacterium]|nr:molybdenum cofactor guanylyltransferase [Chloroflexota bacterium]
MPDLGGLILAGGKGTRLGGVNKALLDIGGCTTLERVLRALRCLPLRDLTLVTNDDVLASVPGVRLIFDPQPHAGVLPALLAGLEASAAELCVTAACDMPFLSPAVYESLLAQANGYDVVIPEVGGQHEPMCAVYRRAVCARAVRAALARGEQRMVSFFGSVRVRTVGEAALRRVDPELLTCFNINTADDLARARALAAQAARGHSSLMF